MIEPVLRLLHFSDVHFGSGAMSPIQRWLAARAFAPVLGNLFKKLEAGLAPHDPKAVIRLRESIVRFVNNNRSDPYAGRTRLVVTGDLSTWGDDQSIQGVLRVLNRIQAKAGLPDPIVLYGNHDVWPGSIGTLPAQRTTADLSARRTRLRSSTFPQNYPRAVATHAFCHGAKQLVLYEFNTVQHELRPNTLAEGRFREDRYWEAGAKQCQLQALQAAVGPQDYVVALTHHPISDYPNSANVVADCSRVARAFSSRGGPGTLPLVSIVLSGHTHKLFPAFGQLPSTWAPRNTPAQLTIGTATQAPFATVIENQWQRIQIDYDNSNDELLFERIVYRWDGFGEFEPDVDQAGYPLAEVLRVSCH